MSDTLARTEAHLETRYRERSAGQRIEMACGMFAAAVAIARAGICAAEPGLPESEIRVRLLARLYAGELPPELLAHISDRLRQAAMAQPSRRSGA